MSNELPDFLERLPSTPSPELEDEVRIGNQRYKRIPMENEDKNRGDVSNESPSPTHPNSHEALIIAATKALGYIESGLMHIHPEDAVIESGVVRAQLRAALAHAELYPAPLNFKDAVETLNRCRHEGYDDWYIRDTRAEPAKADSNPYVSFDEFVAIAIAEKYIRRGSRNVKK